MQRNYYIDLGTQTREDLIEFGCNVLHLEEWGPLFVNRVEPAFAKICKFLTLAVGVHLPALRVSDIAEQTDDWSFEKLSKVLSYKTIITDGRQHICVLSPSPAAKGLQRPRLVMKASFGFKVIRSVGDGGRRQQQQHRASRGVFLHFLFLCDRVQHQLFEHCSSLADSHAAN